MISRLSQEQKKRGGNKTSEQATPSLYLRVMDATNQDILIGIKKLIESSPGQMSVVLVLGDSTSKTPLKLPIKASGNEKLLGSLKDFIGPENVIMR